MSDNNQNLNSSGDEPSIGVVIFGVLLIFACIFLFLYDNGDSGSHSSTRGRSGYCYYCDKPAFAKFGQHELCKKHYNEFMASYYDWMDDQ